MKQILLFCYLFVVPLYLSGQSLFNSSFVREERENNPDGAFISLERALNSHEELPFTNPTGNSEIEIYVLPIILYGSWNSNLPYGDRDASLWQGRGLNSSLTAGLFSRGSWWSLILAPEFAITENKSFELGPSGFTDNPFGHVTTTIDLPQRMGDDILTLRGFGQSEARVNLRDFTLGVGTQNLAVGPARYNPIVLSEQAPGFPHLDFGIDQTSTPIGSIDFRVLWGYLKESIAYDTNTDNNTTLISMLLFSYRPEWIPFLTLGAYRTALVNRTDATNRFLWQVFDVRPRGGNTDTGDPVYGTDLMDQMMALSLQVEFEEQGFRGYLEWAREDFPSNYLSLIQIPYHSAAWTAGLEQRLLQTPWGNLYSAFEFTRNWQSRNYFLNGSFSSSFFYNHHVVRHGYTNYGQILGAPAGPGTEGGTVRFRFVDSDYRIEFFIDRFAVNADYVYANSGSYDRSQLDTELAVGGAVEYTLDAIRMRIDGASVTRRGFNYVSGSTKRNFWIGTTFEYGL